MEILAKMNKITAGVEERSRKRVYRNDGNETKWPVSKEKERRMEGGTSLDSTLLEIFGQFDGKILDESWQWDWRCGLGSGVTKFFENGFGVEFHPSFAIGSAAVQGNLNLNHKMVAHWEVEVNDVFGSSMMFGIGTENALLNTPYIFTNLLGGFCTEKLNQLESCGLSHKGIFYHSGNGTQFCEKFEEGIGCRVGIIFDGPNGRMGFALNGKWLGWAIENLDFGIGQTQIYKPLVASTAQRSRFKLLGGTQRIKYIPLSLRKIAQNTIVDQLVENNRKLDSSMEIWQKIQHLGLPKNLANELAQNCSNLKIFKGKQKLEKMKIIKDARRSKRKTCRPQRFGFSAVHPS